MHPTEEGKHWKNNTLLAEGCSESQNLSFSQRVHKVHIALGKYFTGNKDWRAKLAPTHKGKPLTITKLILLLFN